MNWLWLKIKQGAWRVILAVVMVLEGIQTKVATAIKENEIRATLEKDKIGAIKKIYDRKIKETKKIENREERLKALIRLHEELNS